MTGYSDKPDMLWEGEYYAPYELKRMGLKQCSICLEVKPIETFHRAERNIISEDYELKRGFSSKKCKSCSGNVYKANYSIDYYDSLVEKYGAVCMICGTDNPGKDGRFFVDHDHESLAIRGLLCRACNNGLGQFRDSIPLLMSAISYLKRGGE